MGTNYYFHKRDGRCPKCGYEEEGLHIGKSSAGWCFALRVHPDLGINSLYDWIDMWTGKNGVEGVIRDEYGHEVSISSMLRMIVDRCGGPIDHNRTNWRFLEENGAEWGPNRLLRAKVDGKFCIAHGNSTYDLIAVEFS